MKLLFTGNRPNAGSWKIRAEQLGGALQADVIPHTLEVARYDAVVAVKRHSPQLPSACRAAGVPLIWDMVDPWPQPVGNSWSEPEAQAWLRAELSRVSPRLVIAATRQMAQDVIAAGFPAVVVPHHARSGPRHAAPREKVRIVGYDGSLSQLGAWAQAVEEECARRGWSCALGHATEQDYAQFDIVLALRGSEGYAPRAWKSGVKLANAQAAGIPFVGSPEAGYLDLRVPGAERFVTTATELRAALDKLTPVSERKRVAEWMATVAPTVSLEAVARRMRDAIEQAVAR